MTIYYCVCKHLQFLGRNILFWIFSQLFCLVDVYERRDESFRRGRPPVVSSRSGLDNFNQPERRTRSRQRNPWLRRDWLLLSSRGKIDWIRYFWFFHVLVSLSRCNFCSFPISFPTFRPNGDYTFYLQCLKN
jgi:hypothetical protein